MIGKARGLLGKGWRSDPVQAVHRGESSAEKHQKKVVKLALPGPSEARRVPDWATAQEMVSLILDRNIGNQSPPSLIMCFLDRHWQSYMKQLYVGAGEQSEAWRNALRNTENLIWSAQPKRDHANRRRLYALLPELYQWVHAVLRSQRLAVSEEDVFFAELARLHAAALRQGIRGTAGPAQPVFGGIAAGDHFTETHRNETDGSGTGTAPSGKAGAHPATPQYLKATSGKPDVLRDLVLGSYVELRSKRAAKRVMRLEWISDSADLYRFRDQRTGSTLCLTANLCIQYFREGSAHVLSRTRAWLQ